MFQVPGYSTKFKDGVFLNYEYPEGEKWKELLKR